VLLSQFINEQDEDSKEENEEAFKPIPTGIMAHGVLHSVLKPIEINVLFVIF
jgi:hypothetical protein